MKMTADQKIAFLYGYAYRSAQEILPKDATKEEIQTMVVTILQGVAK